MLRNEEMSIVQAAGCPNALSLGVPQCRHAPCERMLHAAEEMLVFICPFTLGVGYWVGARGMHVILPLDALPKGERGSFRQVTNFHVLAGVNGSLARLVLSTWPFPGCQLQNTWDCSSPRVALLFAGAQSKQLTKGRFIPFVSIRLAFLQVIRALLSPRVWQSR